MPVYSLGRAGGGGVMMALAERPPQAVTPTLAESEQRASFQCPTGRGCTSDRISKTVNRLRSNFLKDHPASASKLQVRILLEEVERQLVDASEDAEAVRKLSRQITTEFMLSENPREPVSNYEDLKTRLSQLAYKPLAEVQSS